MYDSEFFYEKILVTSIRVNIKTNIYKFFNENIMIREFNVFDIKRIIHEKNNHYPIITSFE